MKLINFIRPIIIVFGVLLLGIGGFIIHHFNEDYQLNHALEAFLKNDFIEAKHNLEVVKNKIPLSQYYLSLSYIAKQQGKTSLAKQLLDKSLNSIESQYKQLYFEILANQTLNAYQENDKASFLKLTSEMQRLNPNFSSLPVFLGLQSFYQKDYDKSIAHLKSKPYSEISNLKDFPWLKVSFSQIVDSDFISLKTIEAKVEKGSWIEARRDLEAFLKSTALEKSKQHAYYLIGRSYLLDAFAKPIEASGPYLELAKTYFENLPIHSNEQKHYKEEVLNQLSKHIENYIFVTPTPSLQNITPTLSFLENWKAKEQLNQIAYKLLNAFQEDTFSTELEEKLIQQGKEISSTYPMFLSSLRKYLSSDIAKSILENHFDKLQSYWKLAKELDTINQGLEDKVAPMMQDSIVNMLQNQEENTEFILSYIEFYKMNISSAQHRLKLAKKLVNIAGAQWLEKGKEKLALKLMIAADQSLEEGLKRFLKEDIKMLLQNVYLNAVKEQDKQKVALVHNASKYFNLKVSELSLSNESSFY